MTIRACHSGTRMVRMVTKRAGLRGPRFRDVSERFLQWLKKAARALVPAINLWYLHQMAWETVAGPSYKVLRYREDLCSVGRLLLITRQIVYRGKKLV